MQLHLVPHPQAPPADPAFEVWADIEHVHMLGQVSTTNVWFCVRAPIGRFVIPEAAEEARADGLWKTTCFEAFLRHPGDDGYREWNFSPSGEWAAYDFAGYRDGRADSELAHPPYIRLQDSLTWWQLGVTIALDEGPWQLALAAVLEEEDGTKSYWALVHPDGAKPDFHAADCFAAKLP